MNDVTFKTPLSTSLKGMGGRVLLTSLYMPRLKLNRFRKLYKSLKTPWKPLNWLILGYLIGIEDMYINIVSKQTVDTAIEDYLDEVEDKMYPPEVVEHEDGSFSIGKIDD